MVKRDTANDLSPRLRRILRRFQKTAEIEASTDQHLHVHDTHRRDRFYTRLQPCAIPLIPSFGVDTDASFRNPAHPCHHVRTAPRRSFRLKRFISDNRIHRANAVKSLCLLPDNSRFRDLTYHPLIQIAITDHFRLSLGI